MVGLRPKNLPVHLELRFPMQVQRVGRWFWLQLPHKRRPLDHLLVMVVRHCRRPSPTARRELRLVMDVREVILTPILP